MKILVDADACPVKKIIEEVAGKHNIKVILVSNFSHAINSKYSEIIIIDKAPQAADIAITNRTSVGDIKDSLILRQNRQSQESGIMKNGVQLMMSVSEII